MKNKIKAVLSTVGAAGIVIAEPVVIGGEKVANATKRRGRSIKGNFVEAKAAINESLEERAQRKAMEKIQPHIDAVEDRAAAMTVDPSGLSPAHRHDMEEYQQGLRDEFQGYAEASFDQDCTNASHP